MMNKAISLTLILLIGGLSQAQPEIPSEVTMLESYDLPGYFMVCTTTGNRAVQLVNGGDQTPEGKWLIVKGLSASDADTVSFSPAEALENHYMRHASYILYCDPEGTDDLYKNDASWIPRPGLANPDDPTLISFESQNFRGRYLQHNAPGDTIGFGNNTVNANSSAIDKGRATFKFPPTLPKGYASNPKPEDEEIDAEMEPTLSWTPGEYANTHNIFFSSDFNDVNDATASEPLGAITSIGQAADVNIFSPGLLDFGVTYYWRVDEVNAPANQGQYKGLVWSFTVEPLAKKLPYENFAKVTAISNGKGKDPNDTINEVGIDDANFPDQHATSGYWMSSGKDEPNNVWIQYDFDKQYKIHQMLVWNLNHPINGKYGFKDVLVQYSADGQTWVDISDVNQFAQATGKVGYEYNTVVDFNDAVAKSVRITVYSNYHDKQTPVYGLSEVRFTYIPVRARRPYPADDATNIPVDAIFTWRKGREALSHKFYISTDEAAVTNGTAPPASLVENSYSPELILNSTKYWRVDSINNGKTPSVWKGDTWSFTTVSNIVIDNFEVGYGDTGTDAVYLTWKDAEELGNKAVNGSVMGRSKKPYLQTINHSGEYSAPMKYDTLTHSYAEVIAQTIDLPIGTSDWSIGSPKTLTIWFRGDPNATEVGDSQLYCTLGGKKAVYGGSIDALTRDMWRQWDIDLSALGANLSNVAEIIIGIEKIGSVGGSGVIYLDDIMLTGIEPITIAPDIYIEAENFVTMTAPMEVNDTWENASGGQYIGKNDGAGNNTTSSPAPDATATYTFDIETDGVYMVALRWQGDNNSDAFWVQIPEITDANNIKLTTGEKAELTNGWIDSNNMRPREENWHWSFVQDDATDDRPEVQFILTAGTYTLKIANRDDGTMLDALMVIKTGN